LPIFGPRIAPFLEAKNMGWDQIATKVMIFGGPKMQLSLNKLIHNQKWVKSD
jgi:hypothetical protein